MYPAVKQLETQQREVGYALAVEAARHRRTGTRRGSLLRPRPTRLWHPCAERVPSRVP